MWINEQGSVIARYQNSVQCEEKARTGFDGHVGGCEFVLKDTLIKGRTFDYHKDSSSKVITYPYGEQLASKDPLGNRSLAWTSVYGILALTAYGNESDENYIVEAINEKGLTLSSLALEGSTYQIVPRTEMHKAIALNDVCRWILGSCATTEDVAKALSNVYVWGYPTTPGLHFSFHDNRGSSLVVEYRHGKLQMEENRIGILTSNIPLSAQSKNFDSFKMIHTGFKIGEFRGSGMEILPGGWSSADTFVRGGKLLEHVKISKDPIGIVKIILGYLEVPEGIKLADSQDQSVYDYTRWKTITDIGNLILFYKTMSSHHWHSLDLKKIDFNPGAARQDFVFYQSNIIDETQLPWAIPTEHRVNPDSNQNNSYCTIS